MTPEITKEDYEAWLEQPITRMVMSGVKRYAEAQRMSWSTMSWQSGVANQPALDRLKVRADAYLGLADLTYEQAIALHDETQENG